MPTLTIVSGEGGDKDDWKSLLVKRGKEIASIPYNAYIYFKYHDDFRGHLRWNRVTLKIEVTGGVLANCPDATNIDNVITKAQDVLASSFDLVIGRDEIGRRLTYVAEENSYDPLQNYLDGLVHDGVPRLDTWLIDYAGVDPTDDDYVNFVGKKFLLSCVARAYRPGCKADLVLVAEGNQGAYKSTMFRILAGDDWYTEAMGVLGDKDSKQLIGTAWICELPDMASFSRTSRDAMKAFFSSAVDRYRPPYGKDLKTVKRRCCFGATTNEEEYLGDPTGNRRFLPVMLQKIDRAKLNRDRDQIWAEVVALYKSAESCEKCRSMEVVLPNEPPRCSTHSWWLTQAQQVVANEHAEGRSESDSWLPVIAKFLKNPVGNPVGEASSSGKLEITTSNILVNALKFEVRDITRRDEMRVSNAMKALYYVRPRRGRDQPWVPTSSTPTSAKTVTSSGPPREPTLDEWIASKL